ncbi:MAG: hypothetical protein OXT74_00335 [Candidatus Poribacteria bacterium]|nr:hypothetical protein [Candidatus Poribacteria bacterium]
MKKVTLTLTTLFCLASACTVALADAVPGALLYLDASDNPDHPKAWKNLGEAGGELLPADQAPKLEEGRIRIPALGINEDRVMYYTARKSKETFGGPVARNPKLFVEDWTLEFLCKRNGGLYVEEHHFAGFQNSPREGRQGLRLWLLGNGQNLDMSIHAKGGKSGQALRIVLEENKWTWITIVGTDKKSIIAYQDGKEVAKGPGVDFDNRLPLNDISIGANSFDERRRTFNGSFSIVRVYDKALTPDQVMSNAKGVFLAVDPKHKLSTTWAKLKNGF